MTRKQINQALIAAVKESNGVDGEFPVLKTFAQVSSIFDLSANGLNKSALTTKDSNYFYSARAAATGRETTVGFPALLLFDMGPKIKTPFKSGAKQFTYQVQIFVAYPNTDEVAKKVHRERLTDLCALQLDWVLNYLSYYQGTVLGDTKGLRQLQDANPEITIDINDDFKGYALASTTLQVRECVAYNFERTVRTSFCCGLGKVDIDDGSLVDSGPDKILDSDDDDITLFQ